MLRYRASRYNDIYIKWFDDWCHCSLFIVILSCQVDGWIILGCLSPSLQPPGHHVQPAETPPGREEISPRDKYSIVFQVEFYQCTVRNSIESFSQVITDEEGRTVRNLSLDITLSKLPMALMTPGLPFGEIWCRWLWVAGSTIWVCLDLFHL